MSASVFIEDYQAPAKTNEYAPLIEQLESAGDGKVARLEFDSEKAARTALTKIQAAAIDAGRSARKVGDVDAHDDGTATLRVKLGERRIRRTKEQLEADKAAAAAAPKPAKA